MVNMAEPNANDVSTIATLESNSQLRIDSDEQVVTETLEYTEGSDASPYFIPSSLCD